MEGERERDEESKSARHKAPKLSDQTMERFTFTPINDGRNCNPLGKLFSANNICAVTSPLNTQTHCTHLQDANHTLETQHNVLFPKEKKCSFVCFYYVKCC